MAHSDYNCCAVCDKKMEYAGLNARTKNRICESCLIRLTKMGILMDDGDPILTADQLQDWILVASLEDLKRLIEARFQTCYYENPVDETFESRIKELVDLTESEIEEQYGIEI